MRPGGVAVAVLWALGAVTLGAANFWDTKPYTDWSQKEVEEMLTDSPWARKLSVVVPIPPVASGDDAGGRGFPIPSPQLKLVLTWRSALPVRQALIRLPNGATSGGVNQPLAEPSPYYTITLSGLPARYTRATASAKTTTFLRRGKKPPIALEEGAMQAGGATLTLVFAFPRTDPITLDDKAVEFVTTIGTIEIKKKFTLKDLVFSGQLEL